MAAVTNPTTRRIGLSVETVGAPKVEKRIVIMEDGDAWKPLLQSDLGIVLRKGPATRTWEVLPGMVISYQPVPIETDAMEELVSAGKELAKLL